MNEEERRTLFKVEAQLDQLISSVESLQEDVRAISNGKADTEEVRRLEREVHRLRDDIRENYVSQKEFGPLQKLMYGVIGVIATTIVAALMNLIIGGGLVP